MHRFIFMEYLKGWQPEMSWSSFLIALSTFLQSHPQYCLMSHMPYGSFILWYVYISRISNHSLSKEGLLDYCSLNRFLTFPENIVSSSADGKTKGNATENNPKFPLRMCLSYCEIFQLYVMYAIVTKRELWLFIICSLVKSPVLLVLSARKILLFSGCMSGKKSESILCTGFILDDDDPWQLQSTHRGLHPCVTCICGMEKSRRWCR